MQELEKKLIVMIPTYNEAKNIGQVIQSIPRKIERISEILVLLADDASSDNTVQIAKELQKELGTEDVAIVIDAKHLCVASRGVEDDTSSTITSFYGGKFKEEKRKEEFLRYLELKTEF